MTAVSLFERTSQRQVPQCELCEERAWAAGPEGLRCHDHAVAEVKKAIAEGRCDWVPRLLRRRRR